MKRLFTVGVAFGLMGIFVSPSPVSAAAAMTPLPGAWDWCSGAVVNGCIESITTVSPEKVETEYTDSSTFGTLGLVVSVSCDSIGPVKMCDSNRYESTSNGPCREKSTWPAGRVVVPDLLIDIAWSGKSGWIVKIKLSTGNYRPGFTIGHGTISAGTTDDGDGTFSYTYAAEIEKTYSGNPPAGLQPGTSGFSEWLTTAAATSFTESVHVQVWPRDHLLNPSKSATGCGYYPFDGAWAEANAIGFTWSYSTYLSSATSTPSTPNKLYFTAQNYHFLPQVGSEPLQIMPARIQVFMPAAYFAALGYSSVAEFDSSSYTVTTEDGQSVAPTITARDGGLLINLGVQHYSSPNPTIIFKSKASSTGSTTTRTGVIRKTPIITSKKSATNSSVATYAGLTQSKGSTVSLRVWSVSRKVCRVSKNLLKGIKKGTCKITVTVKSKSGAKKSETLLLKVTT